MPALDTKVLVPYIVHDDSSQLAAAKRLNSHRWRHDHGPVSYTHLDVYKRQALAYRAGLPLEDMEFVQFLSLIHI